jgi:hypothetical protein
LPGTTRITKNTITATPAKVMAVVKSRIATNLKNAIPTP